MKKSPALFDRPKSGGSSPPPRQPIETTDFGAPAKSGSHVFRVVVPAGRTDPISIIEDFGNHGGLGGVAFEEDRAIVPRATWSIISEAARTDFNLRLKANNLSTGRWKSGTTLVDRLLGKELCVLAWASEGADKDTAAIICTRWTALRPQERWWLFNVTSAEAAFPDDGDRGWRRALRAAMSDGERVTGNDRRRRIRPEEDSRDLLLFRDSK